MPPSQWHEWQGFVGSIYNRPAPNSRLMWPNYNDQENRSRVSQLVERGVRVWGPERVYIGEDVSLDRIRPGAELMNASITGETTFIGRRAQIGVSGLARIHQSQIGAECIIGAGTYEHCVLLSGARTRGFAELREGAVLEEEAEIAHNVGLKNTVFTIGVVAGSSINYCDVLVTGGSSRSDHSEIGSGAIHFNFDPRGDKFGSLLGEATGCLLRSRRIFVVGNSGIVGPVHLHFGAVIAAGSMIRKDVGENELSSGEALRKSGEYDLEKYYDLNRKFCTTAKLIGNLHALRIWYRSIRLDFADSEEKHLYLAAESELHRHLQHRVRQLSNVVDKLERSLSKPCKTQERSFHQQHRKLLENKQKIISFLLEEKDAQPPSIVVAEYERHRRSQSHAGSIRALSNESVELSTKWLRDIASEPERKMWGLFTSGNKSSN
jgi:carbonic anhydrase/acetyltransferase-like protein (isoleucine patch superfamily)